MTAEQIRVIDEMARDDADSRVAFELQRAEADKARAVAEALTQVATAMPACTEPGAFCPCDAVARIVRHPGFRAFGATP